MSVATRYKNPVKLQTCIVCKSDFYQSREIKKPHVCDECLKKGWLPIRADEITAAIKEKWKEM